MHTANMYYFPYDSIYNGRVLLRDYPIIFRGFITDTGFIAFFKIFGVSIYKARIFLRFTEPLVLIILYFLLLRIIPWYFVFLCLILIRTHYFWLDFTVFTADWPTHIRVIYSDLLLLAFAVFLQTRKRIFLFFSFAFLALSLLNSPDFGYSLIIALVATIFAMLLLERKLVISEGGELKNDEKVFLVIFIFALAVFWFIVFSLLASIKLIPLDYVFVILFLALSIMLLWYMMKQKSRLQPLYTPGGIIFAGLAISLAPFVYYLLQINALGTFLYLLLRMPFTQMSIKAISEAHFISLRSYSPPIYGKDLGYFILWHLPVLLCYTGIVFVVYRVFIKKEEGRSLSYILIFLSIASLMMYPRSMVLAEELKMIFSMHFAWLLLIILLYSSLIIFRTRRILLYGLLLINFIPTLPLLTGTMRDTGLMTHYNNFYLTTLDGELKYLFKRNIDKDYLAAKFKGYFGNLQWFKDCEEDLYRSTWVEEAVRIVRKNFGLERQSEINNTPWPRKDWYLSLDLNPLQYAGKTISVGMWLKVEEGGRVRIFLADAPDDVAFSSYHSGNNNWEFLKVSKSINAKAPFVKVGMEIKKGVVVFREENGDDAFRIGSFVVAEGRNVQPPSNNELLSMLVFLFRKDYGPELMTYYSE
jgi:hypothetical protein